MKCTVKELKKKSYTIKHDSNQHRKRYTSPYTIKHDSKQHRKRYTSPPVYSPLYILKQDWK